jgi:hypothetical protein
MARPNLYYANVSVNQGRGGVKMLLRRLHAFSEAPMPLFRHRSTSGFLSTSLCVVIKRFRESRRILR